jgi:Spy/CpxP family protein refolding chaperone
MNLPSAIQSTLLLATLSMTVQAETNSVSEAEAAYTRTITQRADKIVANLSITDTNKFIRVRDMIAQQYRDLSQIHDERDVKVRAVKVKAVRIEPENKAAADGPVAAVMAETKTKLEKLRGEFLAKLTAELSPEQVDKVKDGMTYGVVQVTYNAYLEKYPDLTDEQKKQIMAWLVEAREIAMDGSTSEEKHAVFGKYKGKINNYLSKAGYDAKKGEQNVKKPAAPPPPKLN